MLTIKNVDTFIGKKKIIKKASFEIESGSIVGLIGPNGAGKTTVMKTILGLTKFTGEISLDNKKVTENDHEALQEVGALIEHPAIYPFLTGRQNLTLYSKDVSDVNKIISILEMQSYINRKSKTYSLGMKQKLGIAIALCNHPKLIILDEPMNGLDIESTILIRNIIKQYAEEGCAFLISSHILSELQKVMTKIILISDGKIILDKSIDEFNKNESDLYRIMTTDNIKAKNLLTVNGFNIQVVDGKVIIDKSDLINMQKVLYGNGISLLELTHESLSFESKIVKLLSNQGDDLNVK